MRFHHFEGHDDDGLFIDLDHVRTICEDGTREGYAIVHTDRTAFLVKGDYREIAKLVMAKAPEAQADPAAKFQDFCNDILENGIPSQRELLAKQYRERIAELQGKIHTLETKP